MAHILRALRGHHLAPPDSTYVIAEREFAEGIPRAGGEKTRMNLWLFEGRSPTDGQPGEVIISGFDFTPLP